MARNLISEECISSEKHINQRIIRRIYLKSFLLKHISINIHDPIKEIADKYFSEEASLVIFFLNKDIGKFTCPCFTPVFSDKKMFELSSKSDKIKDIGGAISLPGFYSKTVDNLSESKIVSITDMAKRRGYWHGEFAFGVLNDKRNNDNDDNINRNDNNRNNNDINRNDNREEKMYKMCTRPFSELKVDSDTIKFEMEQLSIYKSLVISNPDNKYLRWARDCFVRQIKDHEKKLISTSSIRKPVAKKPATMKLAARKPVAKKPAGKKSATMKSAAKKPAGKKSMAKKPTKK